MIARVLIAVLVSSVSTVELANGYRILGVFPTPSISHQVVFRALTLALNERGHELVVVTPNPINDRSLINYTEIDIGPAYATITGIDFIEYRRTSGWYEFVQNNNSMFDITEDIFEHPKMRKLYEPNSGENFDLMMVEFLFWPGVLPLAKRFDVPVIGITSLGLSTYLQYAIGNVVMPSHNSNWELETKLSRQRSFWQRLENFVNVWRNVYWFQTSNMAKQLAIARKYLGDDVADLSEFEKNVSLVFVNQQGPISYVRPNTPNIIEIGGFHVAKQSTTMPEDLRRFLDEATNGFVYVSLGSNVKSTMMPSEDIDKFIGAFSRLPYKVLWKVEQGSLPTKSDNIYIMKWVPQQAVLAHPNLKVFVYQGGLQSTEEAVTNAVPLVGFPVMGDQEMQVNKMVDLGVAVKLEITAVDEKELFEAVVTVATDRSYKQRMLNLRSLIEDKPYDPLENAVWWTEYVIRHKGAAHLRSTTVYDPWYSRQDMDIVAFVSIASTTLLCCTLLSLIRFFKIICAFKVRYLDNNKKIN